MKNILPIDRFLRLVLGVTLWILGFFWLSGWWSWLAYAGATIMVATAAVRFCPIYSVLGIKPAASGRRTSALVLGLSAAMLVTFLAGGSYASAFFTRKFFIEDFNSMNYFYKQALFFTGKDQRPEAVANLGQLRPKFTDFAAKYTAYRPYDIKGDTQLTADFAAVGKILADAEPLVTSGDLHQAHLDLEKVRPVFQDMFKRNGFSMLSVALVDFHDAMELILTAANARDAAQVITLYPEISDKLAVVEAEASDDGITAIRSALDDVLATANASQPDALPAKAETLKGNFIKVYLKRG